MPRKTFVTATREFLDSADWLGPEHAPAIASLEALAELLDEKTVPAAVAQYGLAHRSLLKSAPPVVEIDEEEAAAEALIAQGRS